MKNTYGGRRRATALILLVAVILSAVLLSGCGDGDGDGDGKMTREEYLALWENTSPYDRFIYVAVDDVTTEKIYAEYIPDASHMPNLAGEELAWFVPEEGYAFAGLYDGMGDDAEMVYGANGVVNEFYRFTPGQMIFPHYKPVAVQIPDASGSSFDVDDSALPSYTITYDFGNYFLPVTKQYKCNDRIYAGPMEAPALGERDDGITGVDIIGFVSGEHMADPAGHLLPGFLTVDCDTTFYAVINLKKAVTLHYIYSDGSGRDTDGEFTMTFIREALAAGETEYTPTPPKSRNGREFIGWEDEYGHFLGTTLTFTSSPAHVYAVYG